MFNVLSLQGTANQNDPEIPSYTHQNCCDQNLKATAHASKAEEQGAQSSKTGGSANLYNYSGNQCDCFSENWK